MATERYLPESTEASNGFNRPPLFDCTSCGVPPSICGRMVARDGSIWPARDTGFRMTHTTTLRHLPVTAVNNHALGIKSPHAARYKGVAHA